jgi:hypothetical protein
MKRRLLLIVIGAVAVVVAIRVTAPSPEDEREFRTSAEFRTQANSAYDAIKRCDDYRTNAALYYEPRLLEAERLLDSLNHLAESNTERNVELINYLLAVKRTRVDWQYFSPARKAQLERDERSKDKASIEALKSL